MLPESENTASYSKRMFSKYTNPVHLWDWRQRAATLLGEISGLSLLDYGCGMGEESVYLAMLGANVTAIDISDVGIRLTKERAQCNGLQDRISAFIMNATSTSFESEIFDIVHGLGILHHVGVKGALDEVYRLLKPGGRAVLLRTVGK